MTWPLEKKSLDEEDEDSEEDNPNVMQCYRKYKLDLLTPGVFETILTMIIKALRKPHRYKKEKNPLIMHPDRYRYLPFFFFNCIERDPL